MWIDSHLSKALLKYNTFLEIFKEIVLWKEEKQTEYA